MTRTDKWQDELYRLDIADPDSKGCTITLGEYLRVDCPELEQFISQVQQDTIEECIEICERFQWDDGLIGSDAIKAITKLKEKYD